MCSTDQQGFRNHERDFGGEIVSLIPANPHACSLCHGSCFSTRRHKFQYLVNAVLSSSKYPAIEPFSISPLPKVSSNISRVCSLGFSTNQKHWFSGYCHSAAQTNSMWSQISNGTGSLPFSKSKLSAKIKPACLLENSPPSFVFHRKSSGNFIAILPSKQI